MDLVIKLKMYSKIIPVIPNAMKKELVILTSRLSNKRIYLIGTAHVSKNSVTHVRDLINIVKPKYVYLELCESRQHLLDKVEDEDEKKDLPWKVSLQRLAEGKENIFTVLYQKMSRDVGMLSRYRTS